MRWIMPALLGLAMPVVLAQTAPEAPATPLDEVQIKGRHERKPTVGEVLGKAMQPVDRPANHDLNQASAGMRKMAERINDVDPTHHRAPDGFTGGDPPETCGADLSQGCAVPR